MFSPIQIDKSALGILNLISAAHVNATQTFHTVIVLQQLLTNDQIMCVIFSSSSCFARQIAQLQKYHRNLD